MENSPGNIETQIDCFLEQFKRSASKVMEERNTNNIVNSTNIDTVTRSRSLCLNTDSPSGIFFCHIIKCFTPCLVK